MAPKWGNVSSRRHHRRQQSQFARLDLKAEILRIDAALGEAAGDEPQARLPGAREHIAQLLFLAKAPYRADAGRHVVAEKPADQRVLTLVSGRQHNEVG